jgi:hypothetical protein
MSPRLAPPKECFPRSFVGRDRCYWGAIRSVVQCADVLGAALREPGWKPH